MKACTAVVIEVSNSTGQKYEADIEFFTKEVGINVMSGTTVDFNVTGIEVINQKPKAAIFNKCEAFTLYCVMLYWILVLIHCIDTIPDQPQSISVHWFPSHNQEFYEHVSMSRHFLILGMAGWVEATLGIIRNWNGYHIQKPVTWGTGGLEQGAGSVWRVFSFRYARRPHETKWGHKTFRYSVPHRRRWGRKQCMLIQRCCQRHSD